MARKHVLLTEGMGAIRKLLCLLSVFALCTVYVFGQRDTGTINGTVTDQSGAVVTGAKVTTTSAATGAVRTTATNSAGAYSLAALPPGQYDVNIESPNFAKFTQRVTLTVGSMTEVSARLAVAEQATTVEVTASGGAATVNTENAALSDTVTSKDLENLPTSPTRNPYALVAISANTVIDNNSQRGAGYSINGQRSSSTDILLDGGENVDTFAANVGQTVPLDSVQEFTVMTNNFGAEYGRASGGVVNLVTKSGTNSFHGSVYEYNRISALSSNTYQNGSTDTPKGVFTRNDFGFAVGGPILKNKLFFFNNTEWVRVRSNAPILYNIMDPASVATLPADAQAFFQKYGTLSPGVTTVAKAPCTANTTLICDTVRFAVPSDAGGGVPQNTWMEVGRIDFNISDKTTLFGRYAAYNETDFPGVISNSPYAGYNTGQTQFDQNYEFSLTHIFSPTVVNTAKVLYNRLNGPIQPLGVNPASPTLYINPAVSSINIGAGSFPLIFPGYSETTPGNGIPFGGPQNLYQFYDDVSWTHGAHQFKFGGQYINLRDNRVFGAYLNPVMELTNGNVDSGLANLQAGTIETFEGAVYPQGKFPCVRDVNTGSPIVTPACTLQLPVGSPDFERNYRYNDFALYAQDSWKVTPRFTLNLGLRWEYYGVQHNANTALDSNFVMGPGSNIFDQIRNGSVQLAKNGGVFWKPAYHNFGPRIGFAWDIFGDGKTSLRAGYSRSYERNFGNVTFNAIQNPPNYAVVSLTSNQDVPFAMPIFTDTAGPLSGTGTKALPAVSQRAINQNIATAYADSWNATIERQVGKGVFSVGYAGSHGVHLYDIANINPLFSGGWLGDTRTENRLNLQYSNMNYRSDQGFSHYNALLVRYAVNNLFNYGLNLGANYTWSHATDNLSSTFSEDFGAISAPYQLGYLDAFNPRLNYGNADFDVRHRFNLSGSWDIPWMTKSSNGVARSVLGGWGLGGILTIRTGSPFTVYDGTNATQTAFPLYTPPTPLPTSGSSVAIPNGGNAFNYIALPAVTNPNGSFTIENVGNSIGYPNCGLLHSGCRYTLNGQPYPERNQFFGPGYWNIDMNFYKNFKLTERFNLQFRAEMYNLFNHSNQYVQSLNLDVSSLSSPFIQSEKGGIFGYAGQPNDERRNIQFGLKLTF